MFDVKSRMAKVGMFMLDKSGDENARAIRTYRNAVTALETSYTAINNAGLAVSDFDFELGHSMKEIADLVATLRNHMKEDKKEVNCSD